MKTIFFHHAMRLFLIMKKHLSKNIGHFFKKDGHFSKNIGHFWKNLPYF